MWLRTLVRRIPCVLPSSRPCSLAQFYPLRVRVTIKGRLNQNREHSWKQQFKRFISDVPGHSAMGCCCLLSRTPGCANDSLRCSVNYPSMEILRDALVVGLYFGSFFLRSEETEPWHRQDSLCPGLYLYISLLDLFLSQLFSSTRYCAPITKSF